MWIPIPFGASHKANKVCIGSRICSRELLTLYLSLTPQVRVGSHQAAGSEPAPLEFHHRRVLRRLRLSATKVSLSSAYVMASFWVLLKFLHISLIARSLRGHGGLMKPANPVTYGHSAGNVPDEWVFNCKRSARVFVLSPNRTKNSQNTPLS